LDDWDDWMIPPPPEGVVATKAVIYHCISRVVDRRFAFGQMQSSMEFGIYKKTCLTRFPDWVRTRRPTLISLPMKAPKR
jgi:hypothetical protein